MNPDIDRYVRTTSTPKDSAPMTTSWCNEDPRPRFPTPATLIVVMKHEVGDTCDACSIFDLREDGVYFGQGDYRFRVHLEKWPEHWYWTQAP